MFSGEQEKGFKAEMIKGIRIRQPGYASDDAFGLSDLRCLCSVIFRLQSRKRMKGYSAFTV
ncbi:MAG: hypothetical protein CMI13_08780 [Oleibacter sp.]|nr:hypothetical protein [Thalassolituus sp.]